MQKIVEHDGAKVILGSLTYGGRRDKRRLMRKFAPDLPEDATIDAKDDHAAAADLLFIAPHIQALEGVTLRIPSLADTEAEFAKSMSDFDQWDGELVDKCIAATADILGLLVPDAILPAEMLTEEQAADPN